MVSVEDIRSALKPNTRMIAVAHVSNVCGAVQPVEEISKLSKSAGALFLLDAAQSAGHLPVSVDDLNIDFLAVPGHKGLLGPSGTGLLYVSPKISLMPVIQGGTGTNSTADEQPLVFPDGYEAGTHNLTGISGLQAGIAFIREVGLSVINEHEHSLLNRAELALKCIPGVVIYGPTNPLNRCSLLSFRAAGVDSALLAAELDHGFDIAVRAGLHCAPLAHQTLGTLPDGTLRISPGWFTTSEEIDFFSDAVVQCIFKIRKTL